MKITGGIKTLKVWHSYNLKQSKATKIHIQAGETDALHITKKRETIPILTWRESSKQ